MDWNSRNKLLILILLALCVGVSGCRPRSRLVGSWEGRPKPAPDDAEQKTVLEQFDFRIRLDIAEDGTVAMSKTGAGGEQSLEGTWSVQENEDGIVLKITTKPPNSDEPGQSDSEDIVPQEPNSKKSETRRFVVEFDGLAEGFTLTEDGADPDVGSLVFSRIVD